MTEVREISVTGTDGRVVTLLVRRRSISASTLYARTRFAAPPILTVKETGEEVTWVKKGEYQIAKTKERLSSSDPTAP
jgi:hypothetical protein